MKLLIQYTRFDTNVVQPGVINNCRDGSTLLRYHKQKGTTESQLRDVIHTSIELYLINSPLSFYTDARYRCMSNTIYSLAFVNPTLCSQSFRNLVCGRCFIRWLPRALPLKCQRSSKKRYNTWLEDDNTD